MGRKTAQYTVKDEGRDKGKMFLLTEMSASQAESWAMRVLLALAASNVDIPEDYAELGMAQLAEMGIKALSGLKWDVAEPLLDEMFTCIQALPDPSKLHVVRNLVETDIEEVMTRLTLRKEVWNLHMDFLSAVIPSTSRPGKQGRAAGPAHGIKTSAS